MRVETWKTEAQLAQLRTRRQRQARRRRMQRVAVASASTLVVVAVGVSLVYAGSPSRLAEGVRIAGVDVGGLSPDAAVSLLQRREAALSGTPLPVVIDGRQVEVLSAALGIEIDWRAAVESAREQVDGFRPLRGLRRITTRAFGTDVTPVATADPEALGRLLTQLSRRDVAHRNASIRLVGLRPVVVDGQTGQVVDGKAARATILEAFAGLDRTAVTLTRGIDEPHVTAEMLAPALQQVRTAFSRPVRLVLGDRRFTVSKRRIALLLDLPSGGEKSVRISGPGADAYFKALQGQVNRAPRNAEFVPVAGGHVLIRPAVPGRALDVPRTAKALLAAALRPVRREARIAVGTAAPERTTAEAKAMGIEQLLASYKTFNAGDADRITNLRLAVQELDGTLVPPGGTFSLNRAIGERTAERGFRPAPVILGTRYVEEVGGGTSQVATTVFNAAWEAGLKITERNPHALYISRYPLGRDATVYWPSLDVKFVNDTSSWVLVKGLPEADGIRVSIYGGERRRVVSSPGTLEYTGSPPVKRVKDPTLPKGKTVVEEAGTRPSRTSVKRTVYGEDGDVISAETWTTSYRGETRVVRVGTKPKAKEKPAKPEAKAPAKPPRSGGGL